MMESAASFMPRADVTMGGQEMSGSCGVEQDDVVHGIVLAVARPQWAAVLLRAGGQQVIFQRYALVCFTVAVSIVSGLPPGCAVYADVLAEAEHGFNLFVLTQESAGIDFGHDNRRQQKNSLRFQQLNKTKYGLRLLL